MTFNPRIYFDNILFYNLNIEKHLKIRFNFQILVLTEMIIIIHIFAELNGNLMIKPLTVLQVPKCYQ